MTQSQFQLLLSDGPFRSCYRRSSPSRLLHSLLSYQPSANPPSPQPRVFVFSCSSSFPPACCTVGYYFPSLPDFPSLVSRFDDWLKSISSAFFSSSAYQGCSSLAAARVHPRVRIFVYCDRPISLLLSIYSTIHRSFTFSLLSLVTF